MAKKKMDSQGEIIDEIRRARARIGREFQENQKLFLDRTKKLARKYGMKYSTPKKRITEEAA